MSIILQDFTCDYLAKLYSALLWICDTDVTWLFQAHNLTDFVAVVGIDKSSLNLFFFTNVKFKGICDHNCKWGKKFINLIAFGCSRNTEWTKIFFYLKTFKKSCEITMFRQGQNWSSFQRTDEATYGFATFCLHSTWRDNKFEALQQLSFLIKAIWLNFCRPRRNINNRKTCKKHHEVHRIKIGITMQLKFISFKTVLDASGQNSYRFNLETNS